MDPNPNWRPLRPPLSTRLREARKRNRLVGKGGLLTPLQYRVVKALMDDLKPQEVAERLGTTRNVVVTRTNQAKRRLGCRTLWGLARMWMMIEEKEKRNGN